MQNVPSLDVPSAGAVTIPSPASTAQRATATGPPIGYFGSTMGIASLGLAWRGAVVDLGVPGAVGETLLAVAAIVFIVLSIAYVRRAIVDRPGVVAEFENPIVGNYFGTVTISLSLLAIGVLPYSRSISMTVWAVASVGSIALLFSVLQRWITAPREQKHITPAIFIPVVGNAVSVYAAVPLGFAEAGWFLFSAALLCWLTLSPLVFYRLFFQERFPQALAPQLAILVSSPAVLASSWFTLGGEVADPVFRVLAFKALFLAILVALVTKVTPRATFSPGWWGYTFPAAALAGAFIRYASAIHTSFTSALAAIILAFASIVVAYVAARTIVARFVRAPAKK